MLTLHFIITKAKILFKGNVYRKYDRIVNIKETMLKVVFQVNVVLEILTPFPWPSRKLQGDAGPLRQPGVVRGQKKQVP